MKKLGSLCRPRSLVAGMILLPAAALAVTTGCASSGSVLDSARKVHSYTPCGMMMEAVMPHDGMHDATSAPAAAPAEADTTTESSPEPMEHAH